MESLGLILILVAVAILVMPIVALVTARNNARELREQMADLRSLVRDLESRLNGLSAQQTIPLEMPAAVKILEEPPRAVQVAVPSSEEPEVRSARIRPTPEIAAFSAPPLLVASENAVAGGLPTFTSIDPGQREDAGSLESRIGSQWFNRIGILAVLIGVAWFLKLAFDNHWIGPLGRVLIGLIAGAALIGWSERFHKHGFAVFSFSLKAIGSGTLYLSLWASFQLYGLLPASAAFAAMIAVTAFNGYMAWLQDAELLALYAIAGGLSTPLLVSTGANHQVSLFSYLLLLDLAAFVLVALKPWSRLLFLSYAGTVSFFFAWWSAYYSPTQAGTTALFIACFFLPFSLAPRLVKVAGDDNGALQGWDMLAVYLLPVANAALGFLGFYSVLSEPTANWAGPWLAVAFAAFYLLLMRLPAKGILQNNPATLSGLHLVTAIVFLTIAIPLKTHGRWMTIGWLVEGAALLWLSHRAQSMVLKVFGLLSMLLGLLALLTMNTPAAIRPILNERFGTYCVAIAVFAFTAWLARNSDEIREPGVLIDWRSLAGAAVLIVNALILIAFSWEIHSYWWLQRWRGDENLLNDYWMYAEFSYSALFMLFGGVLLAIGFLRRSAFLRWQALILFAATVAKVFLVDMSELSRGLRVLSFIALGILLMCVSYVYQRDWLNLRDQKEQGS